MNLPVYLRRSLENNLFNVFYNYNRFDISKINNIIGYTTIIKDDMIIPVNLIDKLSKCINDNINTYIYPWVYQETIKLKFKTANTIINNILNRSNIIKVTSVSNETYYGCHGLITDNTFNPMLMCCYKAHYNNVDNKIYPDYPICYINKNIFGYDDLVSKAIIKKIIPFLCEFNVDGKFCISNKPTIIINDKLNTIVRKTSNDVFDNNKMWNKLNDH